MDFKNVQLTEADLPDIEQVDYTPHPKRYKKLRMITICLFYTFLLIPVVVLLIFKGLLFGMVAAVIWFLLFAFSLFAEHKSFSIRGYVLRQRDVSYRRGWIWFTLTTAPFNRIQHCEISQGPLGRIFNLSSLKIFTAGGSSSDLSIGGLDPEEAKRLREVITNKASLDE